MSQVSQHYHALVEEALLCWQAQCLKYGMSARSSDDSAQLRKKLWRHLTVTERIETWWLMAVDQQAIGGYTIDPIDRRKIHFATLEKILQHPHLADILKFTNTLHKGTQLFILNHNAGSKLADY